MLQTVGERGIPRLPFGEFLLPGGRILTQGCEVRVKPRQEAFSPVNSIALSSTSVIDSLVSSASARRAAWVDRDIRTVKLDIFYSRPKFSIWKGAREVFSVRFQQARRQ